MIKVTTPLKSKQSKSVLKIPRAKKSTDTVQKTRYDHYLNSAPKNYKIQPAINPFISNKSKVRQIAQKDSEGNNSINSQNQIKKRSLLLNLQSHFKQFNTKKQNQRSQQPPHRQQSLHQKHPRQSRPTINIKLVPQKIKVAEEGKQQHFGVSKTQKNSPKVVFKNKSIKKASISSNDVVSQYKPANSARSQVKRQENQKKSDGSAYIPSYLLPPTLNMRKQRADSFNTRKTPFKSKIDDQKQLKQRSQRQSFDCLQVFFPTNTLKNSSKNLKFLKNSQRLDSRQSNRNSKKKISYMPSRDSPQVKFLDQEEESSPRFKKSVKTLNLAQQRMLIKTQQNKNQRQNLKQTKISHSHKTSDPNKLQLHTEQAVDLKNSLKSQMEFLQQLKQRNFRASISEKGNHSRKYSSNNNNNNIKASSILQKQQLKRQKNTSALSYAPKNQKLSNPFREEPLYKSLPRKYAAGGIGSLKFYNPNLSSSSKNYKRDFVVKNIKLPKIQGGRTNSDQLIFPHLYNQPRHHHLQRETQEKNDMKQQQEEESK